MKPYLSCMNPFDRKLIFNAKLKSTLDYGLPLYMGGTEATRNKLEAAYMTINWIIHGGYSFRSITGYIENTNAKLNVLSGVHLFHF